MSIGTIASSLYALAVARSPALAAPFLTRRVSRERGRAGKRLAHKQGGDVTKAHFSWYRGDGANYNATKINLFEKHAIDKYILKGWLPKAPFINKTTPIVAFGSCFAAHISRYLRERAFNILGNELRGDAYIIRFGEGMVNTFAIRQQFEWAFEGRMFSEGLWRDKSGLLLKPEDEVRDQTLSIFQTADVFILTLGLSEVWYDKLTGEVFWRAVPADSFDPQRHGFRVSTVDENLENLRTIVELIARNRPDAKVIFTLSPVPLVATFRPISCLSANSVSKAVLRVAIDELMREQQKNRNLYYFPSYEIVTAYFRDPYGLDNRHIRPAVVETIMKTFVRHYVSN